jgi:ABC-type antimicrobial peptide transport system permease subunit
LRRRREPPARAHDRPAPRDRDPALARRFALIGIGTGFAVALLLTRPLAAMLYGVAPYDPITMGAVALLLGVVSVLASALPAWRAARVDPMRALRAE